MWCLGYCASLATLLYYRYRDWAFRYKKKTETACVTEDSIYHATRYNTIENKHKFNDITW